MNPSEGIVNHSTRLYSQRLTLSYRFLNNHAVGNFKIPSTLFYDRDDGSFRGLKGTVDDDEAEDLHELGWWDHLCVYVETQGLIQSQVETKTFPGGVAGNC